MARISMNAKFLLPVTQTGSHQQKMLCSRRLRFLGDHPKNVENGLIPLLAMYTLRTFVSLTRFHREIHSLRVGWRNMCKLRFFENHRHVLLEWLYLLRSAKLGALWTGKPLLKFRGPAPKLVFVGLSPQNHLTMVIIPPPPRPSAPSPLLP